MFEYILENGKSTRREFDGRFDCQTDVAVVGLGTAGAIAAISAARGGASVAGIERCPQPGGVGVSGAVFDYYFGIRGGLYEKINERASELCESIFYGSKFPGLLDSVPATPKALALCEAFEAAGVKAFTTSALSNHHRRYWQENKRADFHPRRYSHTHFGENRDRRRRRRGFKDTRSSDDARPPLGRTAEPLFENGRALRRRHRPRYLALRRRRRARKRIRESGGVLSGSLRAALPRRKV